MTEIASRESVALRQEPRALQKTWGWLGLSALTFSIVLALTLLFSMHNRSLLNDLLNSRLSQARNRAARRIQLDTLNICDIASQLRNQIENGSIRTPEQFQSFADPMRREQTPIRSIAWFDAQGKLFSALNTSTRSTSGEPSIDPSIASFIPELLATPAGRVMPVTPDNASPSRTIAVPIRDKSRQLVIGAVLLRFSVDELIDADLPTDQRLPRSTRVEDQGGRVLMAGGDQTPFSIAHKKPAADTIHVLDQWWTIQIAPSSASTLFRAEDSSAFLIAGILLALLAGGTVGHVVRSRQRVQETTQAHLDALEALHKVAAMLGVHAMPSDEVLEQMMQAACGLLNVVKAFVCRLESGNMIRLMYHTGFDDTPPDWVTRSLDTTPAMAHCMKTREPLYVPDVNANPSPLTDVLKMDRYRIGSVLMFPLIAGPDVIGVMVLADEVPRKFSESERRLAHLWASQCAVTLVNQRLANESEAAVREQRLLTEQIERDAQTKDLLLREMNHRVKNNMAGIVGLLSAESPDLSAEAHQWLDRAISRISTLARAHELFVGLLEEVNVLTLIIKIIAPIEALMPVHARLAVEGEIAEPITTDQAITLAMVINELANNAIEHGIGPAGLIRVRVSRLNIHRVRIEIIDDGSRPLIPNLAGVQERRHGGLGLKLVHGLVSRELRGTFDLSPNEDGGTTATVEFPLPSTTNKIIKSPMFETSAT